MVSISKLLCAKLFVSVCWDLRNKVIQCHAILHSVWQWIFSSHKLEYVRMRENDSYSKKIKISLPFEHTKLYTVWHCDSGSKLKRSSSNAPNSQKFAQKERRNVLKGHSIENLLSIEWPSDHHLISANNWPWTSYFNTISCTMYVSSSKSLIAFGS